MSGLRTVIQACDSCGLCKNMEVSPVAIEYFGVAPIDFLVVIGSLVKPENDKNQEVVMGPNREILKGIFGKLKLSFATTFLVKCITDKKTYSKKNIESCNWLKTEIDTIKPKWMIGMGSGSNFLYTNYYHYDLITKSPHVEFSSGNSIDLFCKKIERLINDKHV